MEREAGVQHRMEEIRPSIERLALAVANALRLELAVFDQEQLFFCTPTYLKKKGQVVHGPSIREVMDSGSVLVNKPGEMPSCIGCRFKDHCPSTIEILCCIRVGTQAAGVVALTSFTKEGQKRILENTTLYLNAVTELGSLISECLQSAAGDRISVEQAHLLQNMLELSGAPMLLADPHGIILSYNQRASKLLKTCGGTTASLWQILPEELVRRILQGHDLFERSVSMGSLTTRVTTRTVLSDGRAFRVLVRFSEETAAAPKKTNGFPGGIVGHSPAIQTIHRMVEKLANSSTPILIRGETGTGKELVAQALHNASCRSKYPFVAINCSSIPENLFESELFGYEEGAFTGAKRGGKIGRIEMAQGGTLFLDELGEMPMSIQPKLLRVLQEYELERVGSTEKIRLDIRVVAATNRDLKELIREGKFREDLYYRINVIDLVLPPLRERRDDILPIAKSYLERLKQRLETPVTSFSPEAEAILRNHDWFGNVRELQNAVEYAANLCENAMVSPSDLPEYLTCIKTPRSPRSESHFIQESEQLQSLLLKYGQTLEGKKMIAAHLGISLRTLYRKLDLYHLGKRHS